MFIADDPEARWRPLSLSTKVHLDLRYSFEVLSRSRTPPAAAAASTHRAATTTRLPSTV